LAYQSSKRGSWYYNVGKKNDSGKQLVDLDVSPMKLKTNDDNNNNNDNDDDDNDADEYEPNEKNGLRDFALWKAPKKDFDRPDATWDTPIGKGRPAWHLECSAMAYKYLGPQIDIHCGGVDLMFPHHENEIAQSEGAYSKNGAMNGGKRIKKKDGEEEEEDQVEDGNNLPFCGCWIHNGFVNVGDEKMSKSKGNFLTLRTACPTNIDIRAYRYLVISSQYRNPLSLTSAAMGAARGALKRLDTILGKLDTALLEKEAIVDTNNNNNNELTKIAQQSLVEFKEAIADDLGTPRAAAILFSLAKAAEGEFKRVKKAVTIWEEEEEEQRGASSDDNDIKPRLNLLGLKLIREAMGEIDQVFGIFYEVPATTAIGSESSNDNNDSGTISSNNKDAVPDKVMELVKARTKARDDNNWDLADTLRVTIMEEGFEVKDVKGGEPLVTPRSS